ncbi:MAG: hypothetical protein IJD75_06035 [Clostridia bacterium]|nr:hypothetical protein [Clostridia bacterium]
MMNKRVLLLCGHYGSGKTNIAVNLAQAIKREYPTVTLADLDIVNPYFRSKDSAAELEEAGIRLICSNYANSNVDIPALPPDLYALTDDRRMSAIIDVGGDDRGALVLGRLAPAILAENDYEMLMVINCYRPLTRDAASTLEVMREIETACGMRFTALVNNSNLGVETTAEDVLRSVSYANEVAAMSGLPVVMTTADQKLQGELEGKIPDLFSLELQKKIQ